MKHNAVAELSYLFRGAASAPPVFLLGAGASYRSGIPLAAEAVKRIAKASYAWTQLGLDETHCNPPPSDWMPYLERQPWFIRDPQKLAENFPLAVKHLLTPRERRRRLLRDLVLSPPNGVSDGYRALAQIMLRRLCCTVLTTNFDQLVAEALRELQPNVREIIEVNRTTDDLVRFGLFREFQIVYLHGAVEFYRDRNEEEETKQLDEGLVRFLRPLLRDSPLIVIGYRGYELSVMEHLLGEGVSECHAYPNGIYWCKRDGSADHQNVERLRAKIGGNFHDIQIAGFDEILVALNKELAGCSRIVQRANVEDVPAVPGASTFDQKPLTELAKDALDIPVLLLTMQQYFERLRLGVVDSAAIESILLELRILAKVDGQIVPTVGGYLLFGKDVSQHFPNAAVVLTTNGQKRLVVQGNLISQLDALTGFLNSAEVNPVLRIKGSAGSYEDTAYATLAMKEACVNLLMHRDYEKNEVAQINVSTGRQLDFVNPGGLLSRVAEQLTPASDGSFAAKRGVTGIRNPILADIFYGLGKMDKAGSGLADIVRFMAQQGGASQFSINNDNSQVAVVLKQASQEEQAGGTAVPLTRNEVFVTNLLRFVVMPATLTVIPLKRPRAARIRLSSEVRESLPQFVYHNDCILSFAAPEMFSAYPDGELLFEQSAVDPIEDYLNDADRRRLVVWLLHQHWSHFLWQFGPEGLVVEGKSKRAFFVHKAPYATEVSYVHYTSRMGRKIRRGVVKRRGAMDRIWHENEGIQYAAVSVDEEWALQVKPIYVFTGQDGLTPLPPHAQTRRATRRIKFDRNKNVEDDLTFWARFLSNAGPVIDIGGLGVDSLVLSANYSQAELPIALFEEEH